MKERRFTILGIGSGIGTASLSIETIIEQSTPIIAWIGLIIGTILSFVLCVYWVKKLFR